MASAGKPIRKRDSKGKKKEEKLTSSQEQTFKKLRDIYSRLIVKQKGIKLKKEAKVELVGESLELISDEYMLYALKHHGS